MKGDFTRSTFKPEKHYSNVRMQQGRVQLDADWNEQMDILAHRIETETADMIGPGGAPIICSGFHIITNKSQLTKEEQTIDGNALQITPGDGDFLISAGRYYVDGILCVNERIVQLTNQPDLPGTTTVQGVGEYLVYLDVWQRHITMLEDEEIRETALGGSGGPDTATRTKTVWQVKLEKLVNGNANCALFGADWKPSTEKQSPGKLSAQTRAPDKKTDECQLSSGGGYSGLENQLYRVEIYAQGDQSKATFKWSRDNGSMVAKLEGINTDGTIITVSDQGKDKILGFAGARWIELSDEGRTLRGDPGLLLEVVTTEGEKITVKKESWPDSKPYKVSDFGEQPTVRRWDGEGKLMSGTLRDIEDGIQIKFSTGYYRSGDYWLIVARSATGDIEWPYTEPQPPIGIKHHYTPLAIITINDKGISNVSDCRKLFPAVTELTSLHYVSGDGQEAMPGYPLPQPLQVRVANGKWPVIGAKVKFTKEMGDGTLNCQEPALTVEPNGIASCNWKLGNEEAQQVSATLLDAAEKKIDGQVVYFNANLSIADQVAYIPSENCPDLKKATTVQAAIDALCRLPRGGGCCVAVGEKDQLDETIYGLLRKGQKDICVCILPGKHDLSGLKILNEEYRNINIKITGCGFGTRIYVKKPILLSGLSSLILRDVEIMEKINLSDIKGEEGAITFEHCGEVNIESCHLSGVTDEKAILSISGTTKVRLSNNFIEAVSINRLEKLDTILKETKIVSLSKPFDALDKENFANYVSAISVELSKMEVNKRKELIINSLDKVAKRQIKKRKIIPMEIGDFKNFKEVLLNKKATPSIIADAIRELRKPGTAIVLNKWSPESSEKDDIADPNENNLTLLENNEITGTVSIGGLPAQIEERVKRINNYEEIGSLLKEIAITLIECGTMQIRGNKLTKLVVEKEVSNIDKEVIRKQQITKIFRRYFLTENVIEGSDNLIIAKHLIMNSNSFAKEPIGTIIAESALFVGNDGTGVLSHITRKQKEAANLINFSPSIP